ncbi:transcriptional regulator [Clostridium sardiniense]|uniref:Transcriptional regulator n=1 Tax=Clostridium sardiniense TaxID=29369 RepID=A0ABS7KUR6_CLOSR|nr:transcriptional regulator [Clostridium sardiniense]MBY0754560.1 transcriptional regulator [Clostridium sardiniense]MDQ0460839.1 hypothetical protein [Clostridium sardiniense]
MCKKKLPKADPKSSYYKVGDVVEKVEVSENKAYAIIRELNLELKDKGYITVAGQISKKYFKERYYG